MPRRSSAAFQRNRDRSLSRYHANRDDNLKKHRAYKARLLEEREFIGWDGEGYRLFSVDTIGSVDVQHHYMLFGASTGRYVVGPSLSTEECLELILEVENDSPDCFHVGFAFDYDVNMILKDLPWRMLGVLYDCGTVIYKGYRISHTPHKMFRVSKNGSSATIYDVFGFFHSSYLRALRKYDVGRLEQLSVIEAGKRKRGIFSYEQLPEIIAYWKDEISLLPPLMEKVREAAYDGGFMITEWHGPGALAAYALKHNGIAAMKSRDVPAAVKAAIRAAYAGGRFQAWKCGRHFGKVFTADINSAYIYACSLLPRLDRGKWRQVDVSTIRSRDDIARFGLYYIEFDAGKEWEKKARAAGISCPPFPLFHRDKKHRLTFPSRVENWYWSPEASLVVGSSAAKIREAWVFDDDGSFPFKWVYSAYQRRVQLQHSGNPAEKAYKWALAAMYGAFARRVGWDKKTRSAPRSHELAWAGFITSYCRAMVYRAASSVAVKGGLVSIDTDGVTSTVPFIPEDLINGIGDELGQWKLEEFDGMLYWQNGVYWYESEGEWSEAKSRGIPRGVITVDSALESLEQADFSVSPARHAIIRLHRTRFIGYRQALRGQFKKWRHWQDEPVEILLGGSGKGRHIPQFCAECRKKGAAVGNLHTVTHLPPREVISEPHKLPWLVPPNEMPGMEILREIYGDDDL